jgi:hypothetical protein
MFVLCWEKIVELSECLYDCLYVCMYDEFVFVCLMYVRASILFVQMSASVNNNFTLSMNKPNLYKRW